MNKTIEWIAGFFSTGRKAPSSTRLILVTSFLGVLFVWMFLSIYNLQIQPLPYEILGFLTIVAGLKGHQTRVEAKKGTEEFKQETITQKQVAG